MRNRSPVKSLLNLLFLVQGQRTTSEPVTACLSFYTYIYWVHSFNVQSRIGYFGIWSQFQILSRCRTWVCLFAFFVSCLNLRKALKLHHTLPFSVMSSIFSSCAFSSWSNWRVDDTFHSRSHLPAYLGSYIWPKPSSCLLATHHHYTCHILLARRFWHISVYIYIYIYIYIGRKENKNVIFTI